MKTGFGQGVRDRSSAPSEWTRLEKIQFLLDSRDLIFDPNVVSAFGAPGDGSGVPLMPLMARHASVVELERTLRLLLIAAPGDYRHLAAFRWGSEWRIVWVPSRIKNPRGKWVVGDPRPERRRIIPSWLDQQRVRRAESFLVDRFRGDVSIPDELYHSLTCANPDCRKCWPTFAAA